MKVDEAPIEVTNKYADFADIFSSKLTAKFSKYMSINNHIIELVDNWQSLYSLIYSLGSVKLEMLKAYIKNNLANGFIRSSKFPAETPILFNQKPNRSLRLCIDYQDLNNLTIKNRYLLSLVKDSLNQLSQIWYFTQLGLTNIYYQMKIQKDDK